MTDHSVSPLPPSPSLPFSYSLTRELAVCDHARRVLVRQFLLQGNAHWFSLFYFICKLLWPYYFAVASLLTILSPPSPPAEAIMRFGISLCYSRAYSCQQRSGGAGVERNKHMSLLASFLRPLLKFPLKISWLEGSAARSRHCLKEIFPNLYGQFWEVVFVLWRSTSLGT